MIDHKEFSLRFSVDSQERSNITLGRASRSEQHSFWFPGAHTITNDTVISYKNKTVTVQKSITFSLTQPYISMPEKDYGKMLDFLAPKDEYWTYDDVKNYAFVECSSAELDFVDLTFMIGSMKIVLPPRGFIDYDNSTGLCYLKMRPIKKLEASEWHMGIGFIKNHTLAFDYEDMRVGFLFEAGEDDSGETTGKGSGFNLWLLFGPIIGIIALGVLCFGANKYRKSRRRTAYYILNDYPQ